MQRCSHANVQLAGGPSNIEQGAIQVFCSSCSACSPISGMLSCCIGCKRATCKPSIELHDCWQLVVAHCVKWIKDVLWRVSEGASLLVGECAPGHVRLHACSSAAQFIRTAGYDATTQMRAFHNCAHHDLSKAPFACCKRRAMITTRADREVKHCPLTMRKWWCLVTYAYT